MPSTASHACDPPPPNHPDLLSMLSIISIREAALRVPIVHANALLNTATSINNAYFHEMKWVAKALNGESLSTNCLIFPGPKPSICAYMERLKKELR